MQLRTLKVQKQFCGNKNISQGPRLNDAPVLACPSLRLSPQIPPWLLPKWDGNWAPLPYASLNFGDVSHKFLQLEILKIKIHKYKAWNLANNAGELILSVLREMNQSIIWCLPLCLPSSSHTYHGPCAWHSEVTILVVENYMCELFFEWQSLQGNGEHQCLEEELLSGEGLLEGFIISAPKQQTKDEKFFRPGQSWHVSM